MYFVYYSTVILRRSDEEWPERGCAFGRTNSYDIYTTAFIVDTSCCIIGLDGLFYLLSPTIRCGETG